MSAQGVSVGHPPVNRMTDRQVQKHYLSAATLADGKNDSIEKQEEKSI